MSTPYVKFSYEGDMVLVVCELANLSFAWPRYQIRDDEGLRKFLDHVECLATQPDLPAGVAVEFLPASLPASGWSKVEGTLSTYVKT